MRRRILAKLTDDALMASPTSDLARRYKTTMRTVHRERARRGLHGGMGGSSPQIAGLREMSDHDLTCYSLAQVATKLGCAPHTVQAERSRRGLRGIWGGWVPPRVSTAWSIPLGELLSEGTWPLARRYRCAWSTVRRGRAARLRGETGPRGR